MKKTPYTKAELWEQLAAMGAPRRGMTIVHTSLRAVGQVEGGGEAFLDLLIDYFTGDGGLLLVPTHTWHRLGQPVTLELGLAETCLGVLPRLAAADGRGLRTENPTHSLVIFGDRRRAEELSRCEARVMTPTAPEGCYAALCREGGHVLLVGVSQDKNTYLHAVEELLCIPNRMGSRPIPAGVRRENGECLVRGIRMLETDYTDDVSTLFPRYEPAFRRAGCVTDGYLGNARAQLCCARGMLDAVAGILSSGVRDPLAPARG